MCIICEKLRLYIRDVDRSEVDMTVNPTLSVTGCNFLNFKAANRCRHYPVFGCPGSRAECRHSHGDSKVTAGDARSL